MKQMQAIYREEGKLKFLESGERLVQRQAIIQPLVETLFTYLKMHKQEVPQSGKLHDAFTYALNQEKYVKVFLTDGDVTIDNNASERAIRGFCIGKKNWQMIDTLNGAKTSAIIYSIAEKAKANNLKPYEYLEYLLEEIPKHMDDTDRSFLDKLYIVSSVVVVWILGFEIAVMVRLVILYCWAYFMISPIRFNSCSISITVDLAPEIRKLFLLSCLVVLE